MGTIRTGRSINILTRSSALALCAALMLAGCEDGGPGFLRNRGDAGATAGGPAGAVSLVERDVEAPDVFQITEAGLWDGRPSLGGVWVAHPDVEEPERVIIRNRDNGKFVIGALFRRERDNPGPRLQVSSDAAAALEMLAGAPAELNVTALRREETGEPATPAPAATAPGGDAGAGADTATLAAPSEIAATSLDPVAGAASAIDAAEARATPAPAQTAAAPAPAPAAPAPAPSSGLDRPYIQIGIFSVQANADRTADMMRTAGVVPTVLEEEAQGRSFWRVIVGPATTATERDQVLAKVKAQGFADAYFVSD